MRTKLTVVVAGIGLLAALAVLPVWPHHSFSVEFDINEPVNLKGTVTELRWINPHVWIHLDVPRPDGTVQEWMVQGGLPMQLSRRGLTMDSLLPGTEIAVAGYQARNGSLTANGGQCTLPDGRTIFLGFSLLTGKP